MPLSLTLPRSQIMYLQLDADKLVDFIVQLEPDEEPDLFEICELLSKNLLIEVENTKSIPSYLRITAPQCIDIFRRNKATSSGM